MADNTTSLVGDPAQTTGVYVQVEELLRLRHLVNDLTLEARQQSQAIMGGAVRTRYRGRGMEFAEVRPYQPGDDIRTIDWRVTARVQAPYTKLFQEERERPVFVVVDQRSPMFFGSSHAFKSVFAARIASVIAWIASANNDRIGALVFGDTEQNDIRARRGKHAVLDLLNQLHVFNQLLSSPVAPHPPVSLQRMLSEASRIARPGSLVILLSDFHDLTDDCNEPLNMLSKRSDVMALHIYDRLEQRLPDVQQFNISNGQERLNVQVKALAKSFKDAFDQHQQRLRKTFINSGVQYVHAPVNQDFEFFVSDLFSARKGKRRARVPVQTAAGPHVYE